jgi:hypothetical protein
MPIGTVGHVVRIASSAAPTSSGLMLSLPVSRVGARGLLRLPQKLPGLPDELAGPGFSDAHLPYASH